jgi:hypothetical protein
MPPAQATRVLTGRRREPPAAALGRAKQASRRARAAGQLRTTFIARADPDGPAPPLARMLRGGRGGEVRLKLYLAFLWFQTDGSRPVPLSYPSQVWAELIGLEGDTGTRRVNEAQHWLEQHQFVSIEAVPGHANRVTVLDETGTGAGYTPPGYAANRLRETAAGLDHMYVQLPRELWTSGCMSVITGAGLAFLLILLYRYGPGKIPEPAPPVWFSPKVFRDYYALSEDTRSKGMKDLRDLGLITVRRVPVNPDDFDLERIRNTYTLNLSALAALHPSAPEAAELPQIEPAAT